MYASPCVFFSVGRNVMSFSTSPVNAPSSTNKRSVGSTMPTPGEAAEAISISSASSSAFASASTAVATCLAFAISSSRNKFEDAGVELAVAPWTPAFFFALDAFNPMSAGAGAGRGGIKYQTVVQDISLVYKLCVSVRVRDYSTCVDLTTCTGCTRNVDLRTCTSTRVLSCVDLITKRLSSNPSG